MAYLLKKRGFTDVTLLEKTNRVSGKATKLYFDGTTQQLSTVFWTNDYNVRRYLHHVVLQLFKCLWHAYIGYLSSIA